MGPIYDWFLTVNKTALEQAALIEINYINDNFGPSSDAHALLTAAPGSKTFSMVRGRRHTPQRSLSSAVCVLR
jgi:hypothetical protein